MIWNSVFPKNELCVLLFRLRKIKLRSRSKLKLQNFSQENWQNLCFCVITMKNSPLYSKTFDCKTKKLGAFRMLVLLYCYWSTKNRESIIQKKKIENNSSYVPSFVCSSIFSAIWKFAKLNAKYRLVIRVLLGFVYARKCMKNTDRSTITSFTFIHRQRRSNTNDRKY